MRKTKQERIEKVKQMYLQGMSVKDMAKELGCAISTTSEYLKLSGVKRNRAAEALPIVVEMASEGATIAQIKNETGMSTTFISAVLKKYGLNKRIFFCSEPDLIDENTVFAEDVLKNFKPEKEIIYGKRYENMNPLIIPR